MPDSNITKHAIAAALKELCREKSFDKISIADITSTCGLNRQTFYYHFEDKYELLNWIYYTEGFARLVDGITLENWDSHIAVLFETMRADKKFYENTVRCTPDTFGTICSKWCAHFSWRPSKLWTMARYRMPTRRFLQTFMPTEAAEQSELGWLPV
ncbi:MAG: TetR family transcriptional regulator [Ruthenibacterium lactatiformans]